MITKISILFSLVLGVSAYAACPVGTTASDVIVDNKKSCVLEGNYIKHNLVLTADTAWILEGPVQIGTGSVRLDESSPVVSTLTVEAGTVIYGRPQSFITITRDAQIFVKGTQNNPVVFTSLERVNPTRGYWGGLQITGNAPINTCTVKNDLGFCEALIEGVAAENAPKYGGPNTKDSSGSIEFIRVEYAGYTFSTNDELNAITLYGVGNKTKVEHIQAYKGADDGVEIFGGSVNLKYVVSTDNDDDGFDWDRGWTGAAQFIYITLENASEKDPRGIEADNFKDNHALTPRSNPTISNVTIIGKGTNPKLLDGIMFRHGTGGQIYNTVVSGNFQNCLNIDSEETFKNAGAISFDKVQQTGLVMQNTILNCNQLVISEDPSDLWPVTNWFSAVETENNYVLQNGEVIFEADGFTPSATGPAVKTGSLPPEDIYPGDFEFLQVDYIGAFGTKAEKWTDGWAIN